MSQVDHARKRDVEYYTQAIAMWTLASFFDLLNILVDLLLSDFIVEDDNVTCSSGKSDVAGREVCATQRSSLLPDILGMKLGLLVLLR